MRFLIEIKNKSFKELYSKLNQFYKDHDDSLKRENVIEELFYVDLCDYGEIDVRDGVVVTRVCKENHPHDDRCNHCAGCVHVDECGEVIKSGMV